MSNLPIFVLLLSLFAVNGFGNRNKKQEEPEQGGKSLFFLGGIFRKIRTRWQNPPPSPYGGGPIFTEYYGCTFYNCQQPQQFQVLQPLPASQPVQPIQTVVQTPIVVQQSQVYQPNTYAQAVGQGQPQPPPPPPPQPQLPVQPQPQPIPYPPQPYGNPQPYPGYPVYPTAYAASVPGPVYQSPGCTYPAFLCGRRG